MIDAFVRVWAPNELRLGMAITTVARWKMQPDCRLTVIECEASLPYKWTGLYGYERIAADEQTFCWKSIHAIYDRCQGEIVVGGDDDMLIYDRDFVSKGVGLMNKYPDYGAIGACPTNEGDPRSRDLWPDVDLIDNHAVAAHFVRRELLKNHPEVTNQYSSCWMYEECLRRGWKQAVSPRLAYLHLGSKYSFSSPPHWVGV